MKLSKLVVSLVAIGALAACTQQSMQTMDSAMKTAEKVMEMKTPEFETAAYLCDVQGKRNQVVSATYAFVDGKADSATVTINRKVVGEQMKVDPTYQDGTKFVEGRKVWSLDNGFTKESVAKTVPVMFTDNNRILARNCEVVK